MRYQGQLLERQKVDRSVRPAFLRWAMRALALFFSTVLLCAQAGSAGTLFETLEGSFDAIGEQMQIRAVHSGRAGCEPGCSEWISAEGMMVQGSAQKLGIVVNSLRGRKLPVLIHSHGGTVLEAMLIGTLIRGRRLDVVVARTDFAACSTSPGGCRVGDWVGALGRPSAEPAHCFSACTLVLAGGVQRFIAPGAQVGVTSFFFPDSQIEIWRKDYRGRMPFEDFVQLEMVPERKPWITHYFEKMGIAAEITDTMYSTPSANIRILSETELTRLKLVTDLKAGQSLIDQLAK